MIPGLSPASEAQLQAMLTPRITALTPLALTDLPFTLLGPAAPDLARLGVRATGSPDLTIVVTDPTRPIGHVEINAAGPGSLVFLDNRASTGQLRGNVRMLGANCVAVFPNLGDGYIALHDVFMRSNRQMLFWGSGSTAVGCSIEIEGDDRFVAIGDDALISSGIWIRNHDMHAIHDMRTGARINRPPVDTVLERHVWVGQNAMLLNCQRVGAGAIIGAQALVKNVVGQCVAVGGVPAHVIRYQVSWGRDAAGMTDAERATLDRLPVA